MEEPFQPYLRNDGNNISVDGGILRKNGRYTASCA